MKQNIKILILFYYKYDEFIKILNFNFYQTLLENKF